MFLINCAEARRLAEEDDLKILKEAVEQRHHHYHHHHDHEVHPWLVWLHDLIRDQVLSILGITTTTTQEPCGGLLGLGLLEAPCTTTTTTTTTTATTTTTTTTTTMETTTRCGGLLGGLLC